MFIYLTQEGAQYQFDNDLCITNKIPYLMSMYMELKLSAEIEPKEN